MIRIVLVASAVILFLVFAVPVMLILERKGKSDPRAAEWRSLRIVQGMFRFILKLAGVHMRSMGWKIFLWIGQCSMWAITGAILMCWWAM